MASRTYSDHTKKLLFGRASFCAFPDCRTPITDQVGTTALVVGEIAHIKGLEPGSARYDASMTDAARNEYPNLILLCPTHHHAYVDAAPDAYGCEEIGSWKMAQEQWLLDRMSEEMPHVTFVELDVVMKAISGGTPTEPTQDLTLVPPALKMRKNGLTASSGITMGLAKAVEVKGI